nr:hypothetical protein [Tanacetum cinerariifolium]
SLYYIKNGAAAGEDAAKDEDDDNEVSAEPTPPSPIPITPPPSPTQEHIPSPPQAHIEITKLKQRVRRLEKERQFKSSGLKRLRKVGTAQRVESSADTVMDDQEDASKHMQDTDEAEPVEVEEVIQVVTAAKLMTEDDVMEQMKIKEKQDNTIMRYQALKRKPVTEAQERKNMMIYLKNMAGFKMDFFKGMTYNDIRPIFEKHYNSIKAFLEKGEKDIEEEENKRKEDTHELLHKLLEDLKIISEKLAEYINSPSWNCPTFYDNDDEHSIQYKEYLEYSSNAIAPILPTEEPKYSLSMRDEYLSTIPKTESDEVIKSSVANLVPIPSESDVTSDNESECDVLVCDDFTTFSNPLFDSNDDFTSSDDESLSDKDEADFDLEEEIYLVENLLYDNSSPRPSNELNAKIANTILESLSPSPIPVEDSDSQIEEIDLFLDTDDLMPSDIEKDDYDLEGDIHILEELLSNDVTPPFLTYSIGS